MGSTTKEEYWEKYGKDSFEFGQNQLVEFDFPKTEKRYMLIYESFSASIEEAYFWVLTQFQYDLNMPEIEKINDVFAASEHSTFFNVAAQRVGINQDKVTQYLGTIGKMIKDMFSIVRELRIIDERLEMYYKSKKVPTFDYNHEEWEEERDKDTQENHEIMLKGLFVDMAEGGPKNAGSVFGLAQQLQYTTLPDLFFSIHPGTDKEVAEYVDNLEFNDQLKWVLKRKLITYLKWKGNTYREHLNRKMHTVRYLRQHYMSIKTYIAWIKPYLRNVSRMQNDYSKNDTAELVSAFENSMLEVEFIAKHLPEGNEDVYACISAHFNYRTMPQMNYQAEGYQRAPLHVGEVKIQLRGYAWTQDQINEYKAMRSMEDLELAASVEKSLMDAMDALGEDLERYLLEAEESLEATKKKKGKSDSGAERPRNTDPFMALFGAFSSPFKSNRPKSKKGKSAAAVAAEAKATEKRRAAERQRAQGFYPIRMWLTYKNFKKSHRLFTW